MRVYLAKSGEMRGNEQKSSGAPGNRSGNVAVSCIKKSKIYKKKKNVTNGSSWICGSCGQSFKFAYSSPGGGPGNVESKNILYADK